MTNLFDRILSRDLQLHETHRHFTTVMINARIQARIYADSPFYLAILCVDETPTVKEIMISDIIDYISKLKAESNFHTFLIDHTTVK